ncbi:MAG: hypothetical protein H6766_05995 [Candidatus Peribacteria bacterium]|nr:MAG: hypothetical protein H6766_05995 [Candidatus Peribacteria bacterium]
MTSRLRRRVLLTLGLIGLISISCRWYGERPTTSLAWLMIGIVSIALRLAVDRRHQRPYRGYAIGIEVVTRGAVLRLGQVTDLSLAVVVLYTILLITLLLSRMLWPVRRWTIPLLAMIAAG